jgi:hypothetical protein
MTNFGNVKSAASTGMRHRDIDLSSARDNVEFKLGGSTVLYVAQDAFDSEDVLSSTLSVGHAFARLNNNDDSPVILKKGRAYRIEPTSRLFLTNTAQSNKMMRIYHSTGEIILPFASEVEIVGDIPATQTPGTDIALTTGNTTAIAANADRKELFVIADGTLRLSGVTGKGYEWDGSGMYLTNKGAVDFFNDSGSTVNIKFTEFST